MLQFTWPFVENYPTLKFVEISKGINARLLHPGIVVRSIAISVSVCLPLFLCRPIGYVCLSIGIPQQVTTCPNFMEFSVYFTRGRGSVLV